MKLQKVLSSFVGLIFAVYYTEALNTWCCYSYYFDANGWLRFYKKPADWETANRVCEEQGAEVATLAKIGMVMLNAVDRKHPTSVHAGITKTWDAKNKYELKLRILNYDSTFETIETTEEYPFICYKQNERINYTDCGTADNGYHLENRTGHCYKFVKESATWQDARHVCREDGGDLVVINNVREAQVIRELFRRDSAETIPDKLAFVGIFRNDLKKWATIHGHTLQEAGYDRFALGEPNNARGNEFCGAVRPSGRFQDDPCDVTLPFICEKRTGLPPCPTLKRDEECDIYS